MPGTSLTCDDSWMSLATLFMSALVTLPDGSYAMQSTDASVVVAPGGDFSDDFSDDFFT